MTNKSHQADIDAILAMRGHNGADFWATEDGRIYVGSPFSTLSSLGMLHELGVTAAHEAVRGGLELILAGWREDGKIRLAPKAPLYPCYTAEAARILCRFGYANDERVQITARYFLDDADKTGGWRCNFSRFGKGLETQCGNPGATLFILDVLRYTGWGEVDGVIGQAVESLLSHWHTRKRCGPCHYGIGKRFMQVEYPFLRYNLFYFVYILSFYTAARDDQRFRDAAEMLAQKLDGESRMVVEQPNRGLKGLKFCQRGEPSALATGRYREILTRIQ